jgi:hypothetical protein
MFSISDADVAAIRAAFQHGGELLATIELRRLEAATRQPLVDGLNYAPALLATRRSARTPAKARCSLLFWVARLANSGSLQALLNGI